MKWDLNFNIAHSLLIDIWGIAKQVQPSGYILLYINALVTELLLLLLLLLLLFRCKRHKVVEIHVVHELTFEEYYVGNFVVI